MDKQDNELMKLPHLKDGAIVDIKIGGAYLMKINETLQYLIEGREGDLPALKEKAADGYKNLNPWENAVVTVSTLSQEVMRCAEAAGQIEYKVLEGLEDITLQRNQEEDSGQE